MDLTKVIVFLGIGLIVLAALIGLFASCRTGWVNCRNCMAGGHIIFIVVVEVIFYLMRQHAQACLIWLSAYHLDMPSSLFYAFIHSKKQEVSICGSWIVPYVFFGGIGTLQYFLLGWLIDRIFKTDNKYIPR